MAHYSDRTHRRSCRPARSFCSPCKCAHGSGSSRSDANCSSPLRVQFDQAAECDGRPGPIRLARLRGGPAPCLSCSARPWWLGTDGNRWPPQKVEKEREFVLRPISLRRVGVCFEAGNESSESPIRKEQYLEHETNDPNRSINPRGRSRPHNDRPCSIEEPS